MKRRNEVLVGVVTTIALVFLVTGALWLARGGLGRGYPLYLKVPWGAGLKQGQPVLLSGVNIGIVDDIMFERRGYVVVKLNIQKKYKVPVGTTATVEPNGLFGDMEIALRPSVVTSQSFATGDTVPSGKAPPTIADLTARGDTIARTSQDVAKSSDVQLTGPNGGIQDLRTTMQSLNRLAAQLAVIAAEQSRELTRTQLVLRRSISGIDSASLDSTTRYLKTTSANAARLTMTLDSTTQRMNHILAALDSGQGTAGKLLKDTLLYADLRRLVSHMDTLAADFQKNPKKYINLRIF